VIIAQGFMAFSFPCNFGVMPWSQCSF